VIDKITVQQEIIRRLREGIRAKGPRLDELWRNIRSEEAEARRAVTIGEITKLATDGYAAMTRIEAAFASTAADFNTLATVRAALGRRAQDGLFAPMRGEAIPEVSQRANQTLSELGERLRLLIERTGWAPQR
jgi:hypothetical protein